jgi:hypothetical protein
MPQRSSIRITQSGAITWTHTNGQDERLYYAVGHIIEDVLLEPSQSGDANDVNVTRRDGYDTVLPRGAFEVITS